MGIASWTAILGGAAVLFAIAFVFTAAEAGRQDNERAWTDLAGAEKSGPAPDTRPEDRPAAVGRYLHSALSNVATMNYASSSEFRRATAKVLSNARAYKASSQETAPTPESVDTERRSNS